MSLPVMSTSSKTPETELGAYQRGLIDNIIEENQYETAIDALFQVRSPSHKPSPSHIRQLVFLSLHSSTAPHAHDSAQAPVLVSPRKPRQTRHSPITPKTVTSAQDLLISLVATNSPESLGRALPSYASFERSQMGSTSTDDEGDSLLAMQAQCVKSAKHCWEILEEGYFDRNQTLMSPSRKSKTRSGAASAVASGSHLVGNDAWPLLEFLVALFERDEECKEEADNVRYSSLLLDQLPPPRGGSVTRWNLEDTLNIVVHCLEQVDMRRQRLGHRLMALLINLTGTIYVEIDTLVTTAYKRLLVADRTDFFDCVLANIPPSYTVQRFKAYFCLKVFTDDPSSTATSRRPRPQRAPPKPRPVGPESPKKQVRETPVPVVTKHSLPAPTEILQGLETPIPNKVAKPLTKDLLLRMKFEMVLTFHLTQAANSAAGRLEWDSLIQAGRVTESLNLAFSETAPVYVQMLRELLRLGA
ncbi:hypothetical protein BKA70DRAFT_661759 [Coprinopsis sp. MPI-PUGE-AT-0042]|nr:hypothetical protein BKA70DRAFT_661759 [Coprinopsis sp. MPI-PUGE-AT-0042]